MSLTPTPTFTQAPPQTLAETVSKVTQFSQNIYWIFGVLVAGTVALFRLGYRNRQAKLRIQVLERDVAVQQQDIAQLLMCNLAILDGLVQMNCNGVVSSARDNLRMYLAKNRNVHIQEEAKH